LLAPNRPQRDEEVCCVLFWLSGPPIPPGVGFFLIFRFSALGGNPLFFLDPSVSSLKSLAMPQPLSLFCFHHLLPPPPGLLSNPGLGSQVIDHLQALPSLLSPFGGVLWDKLDLAPVTPQVGLSPLTPLLFPSPWSFPVQEGPPHYLSRRAAFP